MSSADGAEIKIEKGIPCPPRQIGQIRKALLKMQKGDSFVYETTKRVEAMAARMGIKIHRRKLDGGGYRFWKV